MYAVREKSLVMKISSLRVFVNENLPK